MSESGSHGTLVLSVEPRNDGYDPDDDRWRRQVSGLYSELDAVADVERTSRAVPGTRGAVEQVIVALSSAGVFSAAVECLRSWLGRDRGRRVDIRWNEDGVERFVTLTGEGVDVETFREISRAVSRRLGGPEWAADTEPS
ncbi:hypothetical protein [Actinoplanes sp. NBRC 103695]|uniref:effector-associated constant component EACC1 n=1 Tax=Actinoplanes sp. NBRC 103695 TaxID=3032202 RepID=UPI0024A003C9|nr:hypothetical protein [Actinoplanes sp. NBRC 103695]GLY93962.1 hypothetical protein Acsp02_12180 [Actinoplanes sp. NBRC 103695]